MDTNVLYIRIPVKLHAQIRELAKDEGVSITFMAITLLRDALKQMERDERSAVELKTRIASDDADRREAS